MEIERWIDVLWNGLKPNWKEANQEAFEELFGGDGRYGKAARAAVELRSPGATGDEGIAYAALVHPANPRSGPYTGFSFVAMPIEGKSLVGMCVGTQGLGADAGALGRPGHARNVKAICAWLNTKHREDGELVAWAKDDPTQTDVVVPAMGLGDWKRAMDRYGNVLYALYRPSEDRMAFREAAVAFLDLTMAERGHVPLKKFQEEAAVIERAWRAHMTPLVEVEEVEALLRRRRYVVLQGPPGTGKARVAEELKKGRYAGRAKSVQFHANTTYESFVGGLGPRVGAAGLQFEPVPGALMEAVQEAMASERPYLLHVDEINRADVGKVLGECLYLLEADGETRAVELAHDFGGQIGRRLRIPPNLHILGTMNSSDRSIALVDVAVRRRFGFLTLWPRMDVVEHLGCSLMRKAFAKLQRVFLNYATDEVLLLMPGHSYFLEMDEERAKEKLQVELAPLLEEYLAQGYVSGFREEVRAYLQWLRAVRSN